MIDTHIEESSHADARVTPELLDKIGDILHKHGFRGMRMDNVAKALSISKRTLYEIFGSKEEMVICVMDYFHRKMHERDLESFQKAANVMEALLLIFSYHRDMIREVNVNFFNDMEEYYPQIHARYHVDEEMVNEWMANLYKIGVKEGMFRPDIDFLLSCRLFKVQMESLKRMEDNFPSGLTIVQAFDAITIGFLRTIASPQGMEILDALTPGNTLTGMDNMK